MNLTIRVRRHVFLAMVSVIAIAVCFLASVQTVSAVVITINNTTQTSAVTMGSGDSLNVTTTGTLAVAGGNVAVTYSGNGTITNSGVINQTGNARGIYDNNTSATMTITNNVGALIQTADADAVRLSKGGGNVTMNNYGSVISLNASAAGSQAIDWNSVTSGANTLNNYSTGLLKAFASDAVRPGVNGVIVNSGTIYSVEVGGSTGSDGIDAQTNSGIKVTNSGIIEGARHGITGGNTSSPGTYSISGTNQVGGIIKGDEGSGINIDGLNGNETATFTNNGTITGNGTTGDGDGIDVDGVITLTNTGLIRSINAYSAANTGASEGITVGGGTIVNSGTIEGDLNVGNTSAVGRGITLAGIDTSGTEEGIYSNSSITNSGLIRGQTGQGIYVGGTATAFTVTINNQAGGIIEGGGTSAALQSGPNNDTVTNSGSIIADSTGKAIDLGAGNDSLTISGGVAGVTGDITGGAGTNTLTINPGAGNGFTYGGSISNFNGVTVSSGTVTLSGNSTYSGLTSITGGKLIVSGSIAASVSAQVGTTLASGNNTTSTVGSVTLLSDASLGGTLAPGNTGGTSLTSIGKLTVAGSLTLGTASTAAKAHLALEFGGTSAGTTYDQVALTGASTLNLTNVNLDGSLLNGFTPTNATSAIALDGDMFFLVIGAGSINGHFANESAATSWSNGFNSISFSGKTFLVSYTASFNNGTSSSFTGGNDIAIMAIPEPRTWVMIIGGFGVLAFAQRTRRLRSLRLQ